MAALVVALTLLVRPLPLFTLFGAFIALAVHRKGWRRVIDSSFLIFTFIALTPMVLYYAYGLFSAGFLVTQAEMSFRPNLLLHREFWEGWITVGAGAVGYTAIAGRATWFGHC